MCSHQQDKRVKKKDKSKLRAVEKMIRDVMMLQMTY